MKKRFLAAALALVLAIGLAIPAFAADESSSSVPAVDIHLPGGGSTEASTGTYQVRRASAMALTDKTTGTTLGHMITRSSEPQAFELTVYPLPLGTTITTNNWRKHAMASTTNGCLILNRILLCTPLRRIRSRIPRLKMGGITRRGISQRMIPLISGSLILCPAP